MKPQFEFKTVEAIKSPSPPPVNKRPYVLYAFYASAGWKVHSGSYETPEEAERDIGKLELRGWTYVQILKLP